MACGLDAMAGDPYARMNVSPQWYGWLAAELRERDVAPVVFNLEGGYNPAKTAVASRHVIEGLTTTPSEQFLRDLHLIKGTRSAFSPLPIIVDGAAAHFSPAAPDLFGEAGPAVPAVSASPVSPMEQPRQQTYEHGELRLYCPANNKKAEIDEARITQLNRIQTLRRKKSRSNSNSSTTSKDSSVSPTKVA